jgi:hypothetical protein
MPNQKNTSDPVLEASLQQLEIQALNFAYRFTKDSQARVWYLQKTQEYSRQLRQAYERGEMTAQKAAEAANQMRNEMLELSRARSSDFGKAYAESIKKKGKALEELLEYYSQEKFKKPFKDLGKQQQNKVLLEIVDSAGRPNPKYTSQARRLGGAARALWVLGAAIAIYNISVSGNKVEAAAREGVNIAGGFGGGMAGGALAGIWFGPVGVAVGAAIGGIVGSICADELFVEFAPLGTESVKTVIDQHTKPFYTDEEGLAKSIYKHAGIDTNLVKAVFATLAERYSSDSDDVALAYVELVKSQGGSVLQALKLDTSLRELLITLLDNGWTDAKEAAAIRYLRAL